MSRTKLYIFDFDGTVVNTPFIDKSPRAILPGRVEKLAALKKSGAKLSIATNQGGVAFGILSEEEATAEVREFAEKLGVDSWVISFGHPKPKWGYEQYGTPEMLAMRKPAPGMLLKLIKDAGINPWEAMMIGDRDEDRDAAKAAGCLFCWSKDFFGDTAELLNAVYTLFHSAAKRLEETGLSLSFFADNSGEIRYNSYTQLIEWESLAQAPALIEAAIAEEERQREEARKANIAATAPYGDDFDPFLDSDDLP